MHIKGKPACYTVCSEMDSSHLDLNAYLKPLSAAAVTKSRCNAI